MKNEAPRKYQNFWWLISFTCASWIVLNQTHVSL